VDGRASICEFSISIVTQGGAKGAERLRLQWAHRLISPVSWATNTAGVERAPTPILLHTRNVVSPYRSREGKQTVRRAASDAGRG